VLSSPSLWFASSPQIPTSKRYGVSRPSGLRQRVNMSTHIEWGNRVVKMMIFFDNVRCIPEHRQQGRNCCACGRQAIYAQLNDRDEPLAYFCKEDVYEARRKLCRKSHLLLPSR
jgi:hypothetical protein